VRNPWIQLHQIRQTTIGTPRLSVDESTVAA
jgi:hypothetical protein